jgi:hypothetical protein
MKKSSNFTLHADKIRRLARRSSAVAPVREPANFPGRLGRSDESKDRFGSEAGGHER